MSRIDVDEVYLKTKEHYNQAKKTLQEIEHFFFLNMQMPYQIQFQDIEQNT